MQSQPSPTMDFVVSELRKDPDISFADLRDRASAHGVIVYPIVYGRAKALLGLVPMAPRGQGKQARATTARKEAAEREAEPAPAPTSAPAPQASRPSTRARASAAAQSGDRLEDMVSQFRAMAEERERYREALERIQALLNEALG